jgi:hypothetical protein
MRKNLERLPEDGYVREAQLIASSFLSAGEPSDSLADGSRRPLSCTGQDHEPHLGLACRGRSAVDGEGREECSVKRSELYKAVWSQPVFHVARQLGVSDRGLAKICARHSVPLPPRGRWAKVAAGKVVAPPEPLSEASDDVIPELTNPPPLRTRTLLVGENKESNGPAVSGKELQEAMQAYAGMRRLRGVHKLLAEVEERLDDRPPKERVKLREWIRRVDSQLADADPLSKLLASICR